MIDNLENIRDLLIFESEDDFYFLQILQRKKENPQLGSNSRVIRNYYIKNIDYLEKRYDEIKQLCNIYNARAMLRLNKRSFEKTAFKTLKNIANSMENKDFLFINKSYDRACGQGHNDKIKKWIIDIDDFENHKTTQKDIDIISEVINGCMPKNDKILKILKTKNGIHLITTPFNLQEFKEYGYSVDIHKDNPINLYVS